MTTKMSTVRRLQSVGLLILMVTGFNSLLAQTSQAQRTPKKLWKVRVNTCARCYGLWDDPAVDWLRLEIDKTDIVIFSPNRHHPWAERIRMDDVVGLYYSHKSTRTHRAHALWDDSIGKEIDYDMGLAESVVTLPVLPFTLLFKQTFHFITIEHKGSLREVFMCHKRDYASLLKELANVSGKPWVTDKERK